MLCRLFMFFFVLCAFPAQGAFANVLLFNNIYSDDSDFTTGVINFWAKEVSRVTDGEVRIQVENSNRLGETAHAYRILKRGTANIALICPMYHDDMFRLSGVFDLPMVTSPSAEKSSITAWDLFNASPDLQAEFTEFEVLWIFVTAPYSFHTMNNGVTTMEALNGLRITAGGKVARRTVELLGGTVRRITMNGVMAAMQNGNADGCILPLFPVVTEGISNYARYHLDESIFASSFFVVAEKSVWEALSEKDQEAIRAISGRQMSALSGKVFDAISASSRQVLVDEGNVFTRLSRAEREEWFNRLGIIRDEWVEFTGHPGARELLENVIRTMKD